MSIAPGALLAWYDARKRDLPWRGEPVDPYRVWISEIMLQQTRVDTVIGYYERFLARFPNVTALADAPLDAVLSLWSGLGYYARARNLHRAARHIRDEHGGVFPSDPEAVRALPGVGDYTAGAILSIAFGRPEPLVDGNVVRVLARVHGLPGHTKDAALKRTCWEIAGGLVPRRRPGDFNQALMELGATVCTPSSPRCDACPVRDGCAARAGGDPEATPAPPPRAKRPHRRVDCALVERGGAVLLVRRPEEGLLGGLWELPSAARRGRPGAALAPSIGEALSLRVRTGRRVARVRHAFSHFDMTLEAFACEASGEIATNAPARWVSRESIADYGMSAAMRRALEAASGAFSASTARDAGTERPRPVRSGRGTGRARRGRSACGTRRPRSRARPRRSRSPSR